MARLPRRLTALLLVVAVCSGSAIAEDVEEQDDGRVLVTCGSTIKLEHATTRHVLQSQDVSYGYGRGSGQQSVTGYQDRNSGGSLWIVRPAKGYCAQGSPIKKGEMIKLQHSETRRWLHSHLFASPLSGNQEISCFGTDGETDTGDIWKVEWSGAETQWIRDLPVTLKHKDTGVYLTAHNKKYQRPISGHIEVFGTKHKSTASNWAAAEGVYFPARAEA